MITKIEPQTAYTVSEMKLRNKQAGKYFFSKDTMRCFGSRIAPKLFHSANGDTYFVTSEDNFNQTLRNYSIRKFNRITASVDTIGDFNNIANLRTAYKYAELHAKAGE